MANDAVTKILDIEINYKKAVEQLAAYREAIERTREEQKKLKEAKKAGTIAESEYHKSMEASRLVIKGNQQAINTLTRQIQNQTQAEKQKIGSINALKTQLKEATAGYDAMSKSERESASGKALKAHIQDVQKELKEAQAQTKSFYGTVGNSSEAEQGLEKVQNTAKEVGKGLLGLVGIMGAGSLMASIKQVGSSFDDQMAKVRAVTNATATDFSIMRQEAERLGSSTRYTATQAAEALENLTRNGLTATQATSVLEGTLHLAQANVIELGEAADIVTGQLNSFHLSVDQVGRVGDVMSKMCASSATDIRLLAEALKNTAPIAYTLGLSMEETNAAIGTLANNNVKGADAGTALKMMLVGLSTQTDKTRRVYEKYGIEINETTLKADGLRGTLEKLTKSGIMESSTKMQDLSDIFGRRAVASVMSLLNSTEQLNALYDKLGDSGKTAAGTVDRMFKQSFSDFTVAADSLKSAWEGLQITIWHGDQQAIMEQVTKRAAEIDNAYETEKTRIQAMYGDTQEAQSRLEEAKTAYEQQRAELEADTQAQLDGAGGGLSEQFAGVINCLTTAIQFIKANISEIGMMLVSIIGGITLAKLVSHIKASAATAKQAVIANAEAASAKVGALAKQEQTQRENVERLKIAAEKASAAERGLIANKLMLQKSQLAETEKSLQQAKTAEIAAYEKAAAVSSATGWKAAMLSAKSAVSGFVKSSKALMKSFILTAVIMTVIELVQKLWTAINSGNGKIGKLGASIMGFVKGALTTVGRAVVDVINWFVEWFNDSAMLRGVIAGLAAVCVAAFEIIKAAIKTLVLQFKTLGKIMEALSKGIEGIFTLNFDKISQAASMLKQTFTDYGSEMVSNARAAAKQIKDGVADAFGIMDIKLKPVKFEAVKAGAAAMFSSTPDGVTEAASLADGAGAEGATSDSKKEKKEKQAKDQAARRKKLELDALSELQQELYKIEEEGAEKRRKATEAEFDKRIAKLRTQLETEKNLTATARTAIIRLIEVIEQEKTQALVKLEREERKKVIEEQISLGEERLKLIQKNCAEELAIKLANIDRKHEIDEQAAQEAIEVERRKLTQLGELSQEQYTAMDDEQRASYARQLQEATEAMERKQQHLAKLNDQYERDKTVAGQEAEQASLEEQKQALTLQIEQMQNAEDERLLMTRHGQEMTEEEYQADRDRKLASIGGFQAERLRIEQEGAQQAYDALVERGQLTTQTQEEYDKELADADQQNLTAKKKINDAYVADEQAKQQAVGSVVRGLTGLLDTLGESNKTFAKMSKVITLAQIAIDTGKALSAGIASASSVPFPGNLVAIATTVATVLANIATAISTVKSAHFAEGGKVRGAGTSTSDSVPAMLSNGEFVVTAAAARLYEPLLTAMNAIGRGTPLQVQTLRRNDELTQTLTNSFTTAAAEIRPVVSVVEITEAQNRVSAIDNLDNY